MLREIKNNLKELGFDLNEIKIYVALTQLGEAKAAEVAKQADLPRTTAISILSKLKADNYITTHQYRGTTYYWIESPKVIANVLNYKMDIAHQLHNQLTSLYRHEAHFPVAQVYDTKSGIKKTIEKILTNVDKKTIIYTLDMPEAGNYAKIFPGHTENNLAAIKHKRNLLTRTLVPFGAFKNIPRHKLNSQQIMIRELPAGIRFESSLWIIGDIIAHFSGQPPFLVTIKHDKIVMGIKNLFDFLWQLATPKN